MRFTINEIWVNQYNDRKGALFRNISKTLAHAVEELYSTHTNDVDNEIFAHVVQIQWVANDIFFITESYT